VEPKGGLDLSTRAGLLRGGESGPAVVPGRPDESLLVQRVGDGSMPPTKADRLKETEVAALQAWVRSGVEWPTGRTLSPYERSTDRRAGLDWWSLRPPGEPAVPPDPSGWSRNEIDRLILAALLAKGLAPAPPADRPTFIRRATFDLLGLPPAPEEIDAYVNDSSPNADERLIDRLLASPHYGERWGRHWLDVVRFGESDGFENDKLRDHAWRYRDYVINSFNEDKPYNRFVLEQLAGDVLEPVTRDGIIATGFLVAGPWDEIQNVAKSPTEKARAHEEQMEELLGAVGQTFLGLTVNCARCHDHKFDPIPQADYYRLKAVFDGVDHGNRPAATPEEERAHAAAVTPLKARLAGLRAEVARLDAAAGLTARLEPAAVVAGRFDQGLDARRAFVTAPAPGELRRPPITVECWAKLDGAEGFNILVAQSPKESADHWEMYSYAGAGDLSVYLPGYAPAEIRSGVRVTDGQWHHVGFSFSGDGVRLFVDGRLAKQASVARAREPVSGDAVGHLWIGAYPPQKLGCAGVIDEVRIRAGVHDLGSLPMGPLAADDQTIALWRLDGLDVSPLGRLDTIGPPPADDGGRRRQLRAELDRIEAELQAKALPLTYSGIRRQPGPVRVLLRGDLGKPGPVVSPQGLSCVRSPEPDLGLRPDAPEGQRRLKFAEWVVRQDNPLTARVMVNRAWHYHFGQGLVETPSDLGWNGGRPSHPELLDWLARRFVADGWSLKKLHKRIMLSATYRQSSRFAPEAARVDADNRWLWRFTPRRLEGEAVRDAMLAVSGELNPAVGGPSFRPFTVTAINTQFYHLFDKGTPEFNRRTVYRINVNTGKSPFLDALDCPAPSLTVPKRRPTTTPLQALALMNDSFVQRQAQKLADRLRKQAGDPAEQVRLGYRLALGRPPGAGELEGGLKLVAAHGLDSLCWALLNASEFVYVL
jgi:uncharacterized small protein (DUF1192 family)